MEVSAFGSFRKGRKVTIIPAANLFRNK